MGVDAEFVVMVGVKKDYDFIRCYNFYTWRCECF